MEMNNGTYMCKEETFNENFNENLTKVFKEICEGKITKIVIDDDQNNVEYNGDVTTKYSNVNDTLIIKNKEFKFKIFKDDILEFDIKKNEIFFDDIGLTISLKPVITIKKKIKKVAKAKKKKVVVIKTPAPVVKKKKVVVIKTPVPTEKNIKSEEPKTN